MCSTVLHVLIVDDNRRILTMRSIDVQISRPRRKIEADPANPMPDQDRTQ